MFTNKEEKEVEERGVRDDEDTKQLEANEAVDLETFEDLESE